MSPGSGRVLARILEEPDLVATIQRLEPRVLGRLVRQVGLEDAGELVALATTEQLGELLDEDVWRSERPGQDEAFDPERFGLWLEVLLEAGEEVAARKLAALDEDLLTLALQRLVLVLDLDPLAVAWSASGEDHDVEEKALADHLQLEIAPSAEAISTAARLREARAFLDGLR